MVNRSLRGRFLEVGDAPHGCSYPPPDQSLRVLFRAFRASGGGFDSGCSHQGDDLTALRVEA
jgi:hypothetical protein